MTNKISLWEHCYSSGVIHRLIASKVHLIRVIALTVYCKSSQEINWLELHSKEGYDAVLALCNLLGIPGCSFDWLLDGEADKKVRAWFPQNLMQMCVPIKGPHNNL